MTAIDWVWDESLPDTIQARFSIGWTWEDYHALLDELKTSIEDPQTEIHWIVIYSPGARIPQGATSPHHKRSANVVKLGVTVSITNDPVVIATVRQSQKILGRKENIHFAIRNTVEEAQEFIKQHINNPTRLS